MTGSRSMWRPGVMARPMRADSTAGHPVEDMDAETLEAYFQSDEAPSVDPDPAKPIRHKRRRKDGNWVTVCGAPKTGSNRWASDWGDVSCPDCSAVNESEVGDQQLDGNPVPGDFNPFAHLAPRHYQSAGLFAEPLGFGIEYALKRFERPPMDDDTRGRLDLFSAALMALAEQRGWFTEVDPAIAAVAISGLALVRAIVSTPDGWIPDEPEANPAQVNADR